MSETVKAATARAIKNEATIADAVTRLPSKILHLLGCTFIGTPQQLGMPSDFYYTKQDRTLPTPEQGDDLTKMRNRVYVDRVRVAMIRRLAKLILAINIVTVLACGSIFLAAMYFKHGKTEAAEPVQMLVPQSMFPRR